MANDAKGFALADTFDDPVNDFGMTFHFGTLKR
jgi:hypothetical protein